MKLPALLFSLLFFSSLSAQSVQDTAFQIGGFYEDKILSSSKLKDGNLVFAGYFSYSGYVKDSTNSFSSIYPTDIFVIKMNKNGSPVWQKAFGGSGNEYPYNMITDKDDNIYVCGSFSKSFMIDTFHLNAAYEENSFLLKLNSNGDVLWIKTFESDKGHYALKLASDEAGSIYVAGIFYGTAIKVDNKNFVPEITSPTSSYLFKFDNNGTLAFGKIISVSKGVSIEALTVKNGEIYLGGSTTKGVMYLDNNKLSKDENIDGVYLLKINDKSEVKWEEYGKSKYPSTVNFIAVNQDNSIYFATTFYDSLIFQNTEISAAGKGQKPFGDRDIAAFKLDNSGKEIWHQAYGNIQSEEISASAVDNYENLYIASKLKGDVLLAGTKFTGKENGDVLLVKFNKDGNISNVKVSESHFKGIAHATPSGGILPMDNGDVFVSGWFASETTFSTTSLKNRSHHDGFVWRISNLATGIEESSTSFFKTNLSVYPNPTNGITYIRTIEDEAIQSIFTVRDICGKIVYSKNAIEHSAIQTLDLSQLPKGTYIIQYTTKNSSSTSKIIVQ